MHKLLVAIGIVLGATAAHADDGSFYLGAGVSKDRSDNVYGTDFAHLDSTSWKVFAGLRPERVFGIEAAYLDLGSPVTNFPPPVPLACPACVGAPALSTTGSHAKAYAGYAVGFLPIPPFVDVFGKAGLTRWKLNISAALSPNAQPFSNSGTGFAWGLGTQVHLGHFGGRVEYEGFRIPGINGANVVSLTIYLNLY